jgi:hypothetical protein
LRLEEFSLLSECKKFAFSAPTRVQIVGSYGVRNCLLDTRDETALTSSTTATVDIAVELPADSIDESDCSNLTYIDKRNVWLRTLALQMNEKAAFQSLPSQHSLSLASPFQFSVSACGGADDCSVTPSLVAVFDAVTPRRYAFGRLHIRLVPAITPHSAALLMDRLLPLTPNVPALPGVPSPYLNAAIARDASTLRVASALEAVCVLKRRAPALGDGVRRALVLWRLLLRRRTSRAACDWPSGLCDVIAGCVVDDVCVRAQVTQCCCGLCTLSACVVCRALPTR